MISTGHALEAANAAAAEATTAFMLGRGLAAEIDDLRFPDDGPLIPAPGLDDLIRALGEAAGEACNAADRVPNLFDANARSVAVALARFESDRATKAVRRIAQLLLGVSSALGWNDAIARAERAAVSVLFPVDGPVVPLIADGLELTGQTRAALRTELSGALCRMVVDHNVALALGPWANPVAIILKVDAVGNITVSAIAPRGTEQEMTRARLERALRRRPLHRVLPRPADHQRRRHPRPRHPARHLRRDRAARTSSPSSPRAERRDPRGCGFNARSARRRVASSTTTWRRRRSRRCGRRSAS